MLDSACHCLAGAQASFAAQQPSCLLLHLLLLAAAQLPSGGRRRVPGVSHSPAADSTQPEAVCGPPRPRALLARRARPRCSPSARASAVAPGRAGRALRSARPNSALGPSGEPLLSSQQLCAQAAAERAAAALSRDLCYRSADRAAGPGRGAATANRVSAGGQRRALMAARRRYAAAGTAETVSARAITASVPELGTRDEMIVCWGSRRTKKEA